MLVGRGKECSFFLKEPKTLSSPGTQYLERPQPKQSKVFLILFFKKDGLCSDGRPAG
jgi:hypothetical protein